MHRMLSVVLVVLSVAAMPLFAAGAASTQAVPAEVRRGIDAFSADALRAHTRFLSSDLLEGRGPGTRGDQLATAYIAAQFEAAGLKPAGDSGSYFQQVALLGITTIPAKTTLSFSKDGASVVGPLKHEEEYVGQSQQQSDSVALDSDVIFVGHGVVAPEYKWDDYKGIDTRGKTLVMLVDDPPASAAEPDLFKGKARTYYGRWTYKYETGASGNAAAVILIHTNEAAGYGWSVVSNSWGGENSFMKNRAGEPSLGFAGWITEKVAADLFKRAGFDLAKLTADAASRDFRPVPLGVKLTGNVTSTIRPFNTVNVVAKLEGADPKLRDEAILYTSHHDHLGVGKPDATGDTIYNGAVDNATGTALLLELGRVWAKTQPPPKRSIVFAAVAAEEQGLLGSAYFGQNPAIPAGRVALDLNFDAIQQIGRVSTVTMNGVERTTFLPTAQRVAKGLGLTIIPDQAPEQGSYYRSDHFSLGKVGIPAFSINAGNDVIGKPDYGKQRSDEYRQKSYHQPSDEMRADWDFATGVEMGQLGYWLGYEAANASAMPNWNSGDEFRSARERSLSVK